MAKKTLGVAFKVDKEELDVIDTVCAVDGRSRRSQYVFMAKRRLQEIEAERADTPDAS